MANLHSSELPTVEEGKTNESPKVIVLAQTEPSNLQKIVAEFIGTFILIFIGCGAALTNKVQPLTIVGIGIVWGVVLVALIYAVGHISGAHFNPAVTFALACALKFKWIHVPVYVMTQLVAATLASLMLRVLFSEQHSFSAIMTRYASTTSDLQAFAWELIATFVLVFTICAVATDRRANKDLAGVAIGAALMVIVMVVGPITGASLNPARSIGPAIVTGIYHQLWVYIMAPVLGGMAAAGAYYFLRVAEPQELGPRKEYAHHPYNESEQHTPV